LGFEESTKLSSTYHFVISAYYTERKTIIFKTWVILKIRKDMERERVRKYEPWEYEPWEPASGRYMEY